MTSTEYYQQLIVTRLTHAGDKGENSKMLFRDIPRGPARLQELEAKGFTFRSKSERIYRGNYKRWWLEKNGENGRVVSEPPKKIVRWEFDYERSVASPVYA